MVSSRVLGWGRWFTVVVMSEWCRITVTARFLYKNCLSPVNVLIIPILVYNTCVPDSQLTCVGFRRQKT